MSEERKSVPAEKIYELCSEFAKKLHLLTNDLLLEKKDDTEEYSTRVVAVFGSLILLVQKFTTFMLENGYTIEELEKLEMDIIDRFSIEKPDSTDLKN